MVDPISDYISPISPLPNIAPFTYKDGETYLTTLERFRHYVNTELVTFINTNFALFDSTFTTEITALIAEVNSVLAAQNTENEANLAAVNAAIAAMNTAIATAEASIATSTIAAAGSSTAAAGSATAAAGSATAAASSADDAAASAAAAAASAASNIISIVEGDGISVDATNPQHPIVSAIGGAGSGIVESVVAGTGVSVDNTDTANPIVSASAIVETIVEGSGISVDSTDPANPIVSVVGGGSTDKTKALVIGTSISAGTYTSGVSWVDYFNDAYALRSPGSDAITIDNQAVSGWNSKQNLDVLNSHINDEMYGYVFIEASVNDYKHATVADAHGIGLDDANIIKYITQMIDVCRDHNAEPIIIGSAPWVPGVFTDFKASQRRQAQMNFALQRITNRLGIKFIDLLDKLDLSDDNLILGFHPTVEGQILWASAIAAGLAGVVGNDLYDDFIRANNSVTLNPSYSGHAWSPVGSAVFGIQSSLAYNVSATDGDIVVARVSRIDPKAIPADMTDIGLSGESSDMQISGVTIANQGCFVFRSTGPDETFKGYIFNPTGAALYYDIGAGPVSIASLATIPTGSHFVISIVGSTIDVEIDGVNVAHITDTHVTSGHYAGLYSAGVAGPSARRWGPFAATVIGND